MIEYRRRAAGIVRLTHPFPSLLDGLVVAGIAAIAGGSAFEVLRLGGAMVALQASIGSLNDLVDATADAGRKLAKPIPGGLVSLRAARRMTIGSAAVGSILSAAGGPLMLGLALIVLLIGYSYDVLAKGTPWSWLPFAIGIPVLPVFGWFGVSASLPGYFAALLPMAVLAGAALAIANARADIERDSEAGRRSVATALGPDNSWLVHLGLWAALGALAMLATPLTGMPAVSSALLSVGGLVVAAGLVWSRRAPAPRRERGWELEAVGSALLAAGWLLQVAA